MINFLRDVDLLILDSQYDAKEYQEHLGWGHGCVDASVALALQAGVKQLSLFHHDPDHDDKRIAGLVRARAPARGETEGEIESGRRARRDDD